MRKFLGLLVLGSFLVFTGCANTLSQSNQGYSTLGGVGTGALAGAVAGGIIVPGFGAVPGAIIGGVLGGVTGAVVTDPGVLGAPIEQKHPVATSEGYHAD